MTGLAYKNRAVMTAFAVAVLLVFIGCSSSDPTGPNPPPPPFDAAAHIAAGWASFASGSYQDGVTSFSKVIAKQSSNAEAYSGRGWCYAIMTKYDSAYSDLRAAIMHDLGTPDANMGLAAIFRDYVTYPDYLKEAIARASAVIDDDADYVFSKRTTIDYKDAHLIIAQCQFSRGANYFRYAHEEINYLCGLEQITPLPEASSMSEEAYELLMSEKIEQLTELLGD